MKPLGPLLFILPLLTAATDTCLPALQQCGELSPTPEINCCFGLSCLVSGRSGRKTCREPEQPTCLREYETCGRPSAPRPCCGDLVCRTIGRGRRQLCREPVKESCLNEGERCGRLGQELCCEWLGLRCGFMVGEVGMRCTRRVLEDSN